MTLDGLTLRGLVTELNDTLPGSRLQRLYHPQPRCVTLELWSPRNEGEQKLLIAFDEPPRFHLTQARLSNPMSPSSFCMLLRKHLKNGFLDLVTQQGLERTVDLQVRRPEQTYLLRVELWGRRGNMVLLIPKAGRAEGGRVLGAALNQPGRALHPGSTYALPAQPAKLNPLDGVKEAFLALPRPDQALWQWLLHGVHGVGPRLSKEVAVLAGVDPQTPAVQLSPTERDALWDALQRLFNHDVQAGLYRQDGQVCDVVPFPLKLHEAKVFEPFDTLNGAFDASLQVTLPASKQNAEQVRLLKQLKARVKKTQTALDHVAADLHRAAQFEQIKREADLIMVYLSQLKSGERASLVDPATGETVDLQLEARLSPVEAAQKRYKRYKKLKRGVAKLEQRQRTLQGELDYAQTALVHVEQAETPAGLDALAQELGLQRPPDPREAPLEVSGPRRFEAEGYTIWVGRNSSQNDDLTRRAHPEDLWLHARQRPGSHVVLVTQGRPLSVPEAVCLRAAQLAAYYSKGRNATKVPVICTRAKFVKKPKGAKPGLVLVVKEERTLLVRPALLEEESA